MPNKTILVGFIQQNGTISPKMTKI